MPDYTKALFLQALDAWGRYTEVFWHLPATEQASFLKEQGFASLHDELAHVAAWWEEGRGIIREALRGKERPPREYDLDEFNAAALARFKDTSEAELITWYESQRQEMIGLVSALTDEQMKIRRVCSWLDAVLLEHLKEHTPDAPRFLAIDILQREWADYVQRFMALPEDQQAGLLTKQGYARLRDLLAHVIAGWEEGIRTIQTSSDAAVFEGQDTDAFNAAAVERYGKLQESEVFANYESTRLTLVNLVDDLPDEVYSKPNVQDWIRSDVFQHYYEHAF